MPNLSRSNLVGDLGILAPLGGSERFGVWGLGSRRAARCKQSITCFWVIVIAECLVCRQESTLVAHSVICRRSLQLLAVPFVSSKLATAASVVVVVVVAVVGVAVAIAVAVVLVVVVVVVVVLVIVVVVVVVAAAATAVVQ